MKHRKLTYTALALLLGLTACTQDERMTEGVEGTPITFTATGLNFAEAHTRATIDNNWDGVNTVAVKIGGDVKTYTVTTTDSENKTTATLTSTDPFHWKSSTPIVVTAWPKTGDETTMPAVVVQTNQSGDGFAKSDFIMAEQTVTYGSTTLNFTHRTARISVTLDPTDNSQNATATVKLSGLGTNGGNPAAITTKKSATANVYEALVAPQTIAAEQLTISVTLNGETFHYNFDTGITYDAGKRYNYTLSINNNSLKFEGSTITDWEETAFANDYVIRADGTYVVYTAKGLYAWADATKANPATNCVLANNITLPEVPEGESNWEPVGPNMEKPYTGFFDGNNHSISNVTVIVEDVNTNAGFFGVITTLDEDPTPQVQNLTLTDVNITGANATGGLAGLLQSSKNIINCKTSGDIWGAQNYVGGLIGVGMGYLTKCQSSATITQNGENPDNQIGDMNIGVGGITGSLIGTLDDCIFTGTVSGVNNVGGITGSGNYVHSTITSSHSKGKVSGKENVGGILGKNEGVKLVANYSEAEVSGTSNVGGVVGLNSPGAAIACYSTGTVSGTSINVGGVTGHNSKGSVNACYFSGTVNGTEVSTGTITGLYTPGQGSNIKSCYWSGNDSKNGVGENSSTSDTHKVDGTTGTTWQTATAAMNSSLDDLKKETGTGLKDFLIWEYTTNSADTPPTLQKTAE